MVLEHRWKGFRLGQEKSIPENRNAGWACRSGCWPVVDVCVEGELSGLRPLVCEVEAQSEDERSLGI